MPLDVFCDFVYVLVTENMDNKKREEFDNTLDTIDQEDISTDEYQEARRTLAHQLGDVVRV